MVSAVVVMVVEGAAANADVAGEASCGDAASLPVTSLSLGTTARKQDCM